MTITCMLKSHGLYVMYMNIHDGILCMCRLRCMLGGLCVDMYIQSYFSIVCCSNLRIFLLIMQCELLNCETIILWL